MDHATDAVPEPIEELSEAPSDGLTGHAAVDAVIRSLDDLDETPLAEHVAVFEAAHEQLRQALDVSFSPADVAGAAQTGA